jgi:hypothetical protein
MQEWRIQGAPGGKVNILGCHSIGHYKQKCIYCDCIARQRTSRRKWSSTPNTSQYVHVSYSERFPRYSYFTVQYTVHCTDEQDAMSSHELQSALMLTVEFLKM